jgi:hypothetical protein
VWWILLQSLALAAPDSLFPDWRTPPPIRPGTSTGAPDSLSRAARRTTDSGWFVTRQHPALGRDSTVSIDVSEHPVLTAVMWPFDHVVRPTMHMALQPLHSPVDYGEKTRIVDRGLRLVHPTGDENVWLYPIATLDGTEGSGWGLVYIDNDLFDRRWNFRSSVAFDIQQDASFSVGGSTSPMLPLGMALRGLISGGHSRTVSLRVPGTVAIGNTTPTGSVSQDRFSGEIGIPGPGPCKGCYWDLSENVTARSTGVPLRADQEFRYGYQDSIAWFAGSKRGTDGSEIDRSTSLTLGWSDQNFGGAPTSGGPIRSRVSWVSAKGGGDIASFETSFTRYFLLGNERYVYRVGDLKPYLDLDPREIVRILDPTTLMERLTQRKILVVHFRYSRIWNADPNGVQPSWFMYPSLGGAAPARAYSGGYLMDRAVAGGSVEYRWPIWKYLDGTSFAEMAWASPGWWFDRPGQLAPGVGIGFRARLERMHLFHCYIAYGRAGMQYSVTTSGEF